MAPFLFSSITTIVIVVVLGIARGALAEESTPPPSVAFPLIARPAAKLLDDGASAEIKWNVPPLRLQGSVDAFEIDKKKIGSGSWELAASGPGVGYLAASGLHEVQKCDDDVESESHAY